MNETTQPAGRPAAGHERSDFNPAAIALFGAVLAATIAAVVAVSFLFMEFAVPREPLPQAGSPSAARERAAAAPRLQVRGSNELREMREAEERVLNSYVWIDREKGIVRIPVERAMEILAEKEKVKSKKAKGRGEIGATKD
jgi:hypothetical protein